MEAVAIDRLSADVFADVLKNGAKLVKDTGCMIVPETFAQVVDEITDWQVARIAAERLKEPEEGGVTLEELMQASGITRADIDAIPEEDAE